MTIPEFIKRIEKEYENLESIKKEMDSWGCKKNINDYFESENKIGNIILEFPFFIYKAYICKITSMPRCICSSRDGIYFATLYLNVEIIRDDEFNGSNALLTIDLQRYTTLFVSNSLEGIQSNYAYYINNSQSFLLDEIKSLETRFGKLIGASTSPNAELHIVFQTFENQIFELRKVPYSYIIRKKYIKIPNFIREQVTSSNLFNNDFETQLFLSKRTFKVV